MSVFAHCSACETGRATDRQDAFAGEVTPTHLLIGGQPADPTVGARGDLGVAAGIGTQALSRLPSVTGSKGGRSRRSRAWERASQRSSA